MLPVVVKLGGSLLDLPDLLDRVSGVITDIAPQQVLIVVGGGTAADEVRRLDELAVMTNSQAHWQAIDAMSFNARMLERLDRRYRVVSNRERAAAAWSEQLIPLIDASTFLREERGRLSPDIKPLPESWDVTSDSIAAWITRVWPAERLVLLKSCGPNRVTSNSLPAANVDLLDRHYSSAGDGVAFEIRNLRGACYSRIAVRAETAMANTCRQATRPEGQQ